MDSMTPSLSVIVCTRNRPDQLATCLKALLKQHIPPLEILVVDNDPDETGTVDLLKRRFPQCRYVPDSGPGRANARNRGILESVGDVVAFVDDDCRPVAGWARAVVRSFEQKADLGCCTGPVLPMELKTRAQRLLEERGGLSKGFARHVFTRNSPLHLTTTYPVQSWRFGTGANMAFRRAVLDRIGWFDTEVTAEDLEMFFRVVRADFALIYEPRAVVFHRHPRTYPELRRTLHSWGRGYIGSLLKIADTDPVYRQKALSEASTWFWSYQIRMRLCGRRVGKRKRYPLGLILAELTGGFRALWEHLLQPHGPEREEPGSSARFFSPVIRLLRRWT